MCCFTKVLDVFKKGLEKDTFLLAGGEQCADVRFLVDGFQVVVNYT